jgi:heme-degrading monooxygenase HmoA
MFARVHTLDTTPEQYERGLSIVRDELLPYTANADGFRGLIGLVDRKNGTTLVVTLWADEDTFNRSAPAAERLGRLAAEATGATRRSLDEYEVGLFEVVAATAATTGEPD